MDENRLWESLGKLESGQESTLSYIKAVSDNTKAINAKLDAHVENLEAHGVKALKFWIGTATAIFGLLAGGLAMYSKFTGGVNEKEKTAIVGVASAATPPTDIGAGANR